MNKQISLVVLLVGISLIIYGIGASNSFSSDISRMFNGLLNGALTERTTALLCSGAVFAVFGGYGLLRRSD